MSELSANPWVATQIRTSEGLVKVLEGTAPAVNFRSDGTAVGNASVNAFRADYVLQGRQIQIGSIVASQWDGPQQALSQEQQVLDAFQSTDRYAVAQDELVLYDSVGDPLMRLAVAPDPQLTGPLWLCTDCVGDDGELVPVVGTSPVGAEFAPNGELGGTGGASEYTTTYAVDGSEMTVGPEFVTTEPSGSDEVKAQEARYYDALTQTASHKIEGYQLTLFDVSGAPLAVFVPLAPK
jgi:heat shock protein HslJ